LWHCSRRPPISCLACSYAFALVLWCLLTGRVHAWADASGTAPGAAAVLNALRRGDRPDLGAVRPDAPPAVLALLRRAWAQRPGARITAAAAAQALEAALTTSLADPSTSKVARGSLKRISLSVSSATGALGEPASVPSQRVLPIITAGVGLVMLPQARPGDESRSDSGMQDPVRRSELTAASEPSACSPVKILDSLSGGDPANARSSVLCSPSGGDTRSTGVAHDLQHRRGVLLGTPAGARGDLAPNHPVLPMTADVGMTGLPMLRVDTGDESDPVRRPGPTSVSERLGSSPINTTDSVDHCAGLVLRLRSASRAEPRSSGVAAGLQNRAEASAGTVVGSLSEPESPHCVLAVTAADVPEQPALCATPGDGSLTDSGRALDDPFLWSGTTAAGAPEPASDCPVNEADGDPHVAESARSGATAASEHGEQLASAAR